MSRLANTAQESLHENKPFTMSTFLFTFVVCPAALCRTLRRFTNANLRATLQQHFVVASNTEKSIGTGSGAEYMRSLLAAVSSRFFCSFFFLTFVWYVAYAVCACVCVYSLVAALCIQHTQSTDKEGSLLVYFVYVFLCVKMRTLLACLWTFRTHTHTLSVRANAKQIYTHCWLGNAAPPPQRTPDTSDLHSIRIVLCVWCPNALRCWWWRWVCTCTLQR